MRPRVLYLPLNSAEIQQKGMYDAFHRAGVELKIFDFHMKRMSPASLRAEFFKEAVEFKPHLIHMQLQFTTNIDANTIAKIKTALPKTIITNWTGDVRKDVPKVFVETAQAVDISLISSSGQLPMYKKALGTDVRYWQIGFDPKLYYPKSNKIDGFKYDAVFAASNHTRSGFPGHKDRVNAVDLLSTRLGDRFGLFGHGWKKHKAKYVIQAEVNDMYNDSFSCISISNFNDLEHYFSDRLLMCVASGRPTVSLRFPGWQSYFLNNHDIVMANSVAEIPEKVLWLARNPEIANAIGKAGAKKALAEHSYYCRVKELLQMTGLD